MFDKVNNFSDLIKEIIVGYDEIEKLSKEANIIYKEIISIQTLLENEFKTSKTYNERSELNIKVLQERLDESKSFFTDIKERQEQVRALYVSINKLSTKEASLIKELDGKLINYTNLSNEFERLTQELKEIKKAIDLAIQNYNKEADLTLKHLKDNLEKADEHLKALDIKENNLNDILEQINLVRNNALAIANEIKQMRKKSQCLMNKANDIFEKANKYASDLDEGLNKVKELENNYNIMFDKNEALNQQIKDNVQTLEKILKELNGKSVDDILNELRNSNKTLEQIESNKDEIINIKNEFETILNEQNKKLDDYYAKADIDIFKNELNDKINLASDKLTQSKADKSDLNNYYTKTQTYTKEEIDKKDTDKYNELNNTKANKSDLNNYYTKAQVDSSQNAQNTRITNLENSRALKSDLNNYYTKAQVDSSQNAQNTRIGNLENSRALKSDLNNYYTKAQAYNKSEVDSRLNSKINFTQTRITKTVGVGGDFANLNDAFHYAGSLVTTHWGDWQDAYLELKLISDITIHRITFYKNPACQIIVAGQNKTIWFDWTEWGSGTGETHGIGIFNSCVIFNDVVFKNKTTTAKSPNMIYTLYNACVELNNCAFYGLNQCNRALRSEHNCRIRASGTSFDGFKWEALRFNEKSTAFINVCSFANGTNQHVQVLEGTSVTFIAPTLSGKNPGRFLDIEHGANAGICGNAKLNNCPVANIAVNTPCEQGLLLYTNELPAYIKKRGFKMAARGRGGDFQKQYRDKTTMLFGKYKMRLKYFPDGGAGDIVTIENLPRYATVRIWNSRAPIDESWSGFFELFQIPPALALPFMNGLQKTMNIRQTTSKYLKIGQYSMPYVDLSPVKNSSSDIFTLPDDFGSVCFALGGSNDDAGADDFINILIEDFE